MVDTNFPTTYRYIPLPTESHVRLLQILSSGGNDSFQPPEYQIVYRDLSSVSNADLQFEAVSYTWGDPSRVSSLSIQGSNGTIGLTANLTQALPHLTRHSKTGFLWIDQLCIDQSSAKDKSQQIGRMAQIYTAAQRVIVWLGPEDDNSRVCKQWLDEVDKMLRSMPNSHIMLPDSPTFNSDIRLLVVRSSFVSADTDPMYAPAIRNWWQRPWFTRGWVIQEFLRAEEILFLTGDEEYSMQDLTDLQTIPSDQAIEDTTGTYIRYNILMNLKSYPFNEKQPLRFLRLMAQVAQEFATSELADSLYAFLGMIEGCGFAPNYDASIKQNFTTFAMALARNFGSLDFLSLWSANLDALLPKTPEELKGFPSWVPSYSGIPLTAPFRLAAGAVRTFRHTVAWNAARGRRHSLSQPENATVAGRLHVSGKVIDRIRTISTTKIDRYWSVDDVYLESLAQQIRTDLPDSLFEEWTLTSLVHFLNTVSANGNVPGETPEEVLGLKPMAWGNELANMNGYNESLGACLTMGRGRRFATTEKGRAGLVPFIRSKGAIAERQGSVIVVLHGCCVPIVLEKVGDNEYTVVGDCYVEGVMHGEVVEWENEDADTFILV